MQCKNCQYPLDDNYNFCPRCGQKIDEQLTIRVLFSNTVKNYLSVDARVIRTLGPLFIQTGVLARKFIEGQRQRFLHPAQLYLFASVLFFTLFAISMKNQQAQFELTSKQIQTTVDSTAMAEDTSYKPSGYSLVYEFNQNKMDSLIQAGASMNKKLKVLGITEESGRASTFFNKKVIQIYEQKGRGLIDIMIENIPLAIFLLLPVFALVLKFFFLKKGRYVEHLVFGFYFFAFIFIFFGAYMLLNFLINIPLIIFFAIAIVYFAIALKQFYRVKWIRSIFSTFGLLVSGILVVIPFSFFLILISIIVY